MFFFVLFLLLLTQPRQTLAQIPLSHLLIQAYKSSSLYQAKPNITLSSSQVLGVSTTQKPVPSIVPAIGGYQTPITIALLGDSMIDTLADFSYFKKSLTNLYPQYHFNILNYGLGASNIEYGLYRLENDYRYQDTFYPSLVSQLPDIVVIESFAYNNFGNSQTGFDKHWLALGAIITKIRYLLPQAKIVLATTIAPNSAIFANNAPGINYSALEKIQQTKTIDLYLQNTINFAKSQKIPLSDSYTPSLVNGDGNPFFINKTDNIHPSVLGAQFFFDTILETFNKYKILE